jgi:hypothetical protein
LVGKKRSRVLRRAAATAKAINGGKEFEGDSIELFRSIYKDLSAPMEMRLAAARYAAQFERPALSAVAVATEDPGGTLDGAQRRARIAALVGKGFDAPKRLDAPAEAATGAPVTIEATEPVVDLDALARENEAMRAELATRRLEAENAAFRAEIARLEEEARTEMLRREWAAAAR